MVCFNYLNLCLYIYVNIIISCWYTQWLSNSRGLCYMKLCEALTSDGSGSEVWVEKDQTECRCYVGENYERMRFIWVVWWRCLGIPERCLNQELGDNFEWLPWASQAVPVVKNPPANSGDPREMTVRSWVGKTPWRRKWQHIPVFLPGKFHGQKSLEGCVSPGDCKESHTTERLSISMAYHGRYTIFLKTKAINYQRIIY